MEATFPRPVPLFALALVASVAWASVVWWSGVHWLGLPAQTINPTIRDLTVEIILVPWMETLVLAALLDELRRLPVRTWGHVLLSASLWAALHALRCPFNGVVAFGLFVIFSAGYLVMLRCGRTRAIVWAGLLHSAHNFAATALMLGAAPR